MSSRLSSRPGDTDPAGNSALLRALLNDTLDPGYAAAARRRADAPGTDALEARPRRPLLLASGAFLIGLLLVVAYIHANRTAPADARTRADLRARISTAQSEADQLGKSVSSLQAAADLRRASVLGGTAGDLSTDELQAGATAVHGPGLRVKIDNPALASTSTTAGRPGTTPISAVSVLTDVDVRAIVNGMWAAGAEAVAVNDIRLTSTSAIRFAGQAVLVDFQPITAPYTVSAIGNPDTLVTDFVGSAVADRFRTLSSADGFVFSTAQEKDITLPASAVGDPRYAQARGPAARTTVPSSTPAPGPPS